MSFNELVENVKGWSTAKELDKASPLKQMQKLNEEWGELNAGKAKTDQDKLNDSIGDVLVVLTILSQQMKFEKIERLINPTLTGVGHYIKDEVSTDLLLLYGSKEIGLIANRLIDLTYNPGIINSRAQIQFHIHNLTGVMHKVAINEDTTIDACFEIAWNEIKDRQGKMVDGVFIKEADL
ncbi:MazG-like family protein [Streptococcus sp. HF-1907]|uniref:MazG-like family protein n=1 Tax=Streptococcus sp. HF-1907 TaxID=2785793 RepID=UPI0018A05643|nr:MazG-like family protein [Streptococcus sp. HF-1907]MBF7094283.1 MazG-like family protein [Streptococcus sp. HF-1907]